MRRQGRSRRRSRSKNNIDEVVIVVHTTRRSRKCCRNKLLHFGAVGDPTGLRRLVRRNRLLNNDRVVGAVSKAVLGVLLEEGGVALERGLFGVVARVPQAAVVDEKSLVHLRDDGRDLILGDVAVDAAGRNAGAADGLALLGDAFRVVDAGEGAAEEIEHPLKLHLGHAIGELTDEEADKAR